MPRKHSYKDTLVTTIAKGFGAAIGTVVRTAQAMVPTPLEPFGEVAIKQRKAGFRGAEKWAQEKDDDKKTFGNQAKSEDCSWLPMGPGGTMYVGKIARAADLTNIKYKSGGTRSIPRRHLSPSRKLQTYQGAIL
jgi:hypothetical protein